MASRHMHFMRKYQKSILAVMGVVCMVTFVVGQYLLDMVGGSGGGGQDSVAISWKEGQVHENELHLKRNMHVVAVNFLSDLIATAVERGGSPTINGQSLSKDTPAQQIMQMDPGIPRDASEESIVRTMLLAKKADEMGVAVDREAVKEYLRQIGAIEVPESEWPILAIRNIPGEMSMSYDQLLDQIAYELKAQHMRVLSQAGLFAVSPGEMWQYHNRLNRRFAVEAYPVDVVALKSQVSDKPTDAELRELFERGKSRDPNPSLAEPGFHRPHKIAFEYLKVDRGPFMEAAKKTITDEQVAKQYEIDVAQGKHKVLELPGLPTDPTEKPDATKPAEVKPEDTPTEDKPTENKPTENKPAELPADEKKPEDKPAAPAAPADEKPCQDDPPTAVAPAAEKAEEKPAEVKPAEPKPDEAKPADAKPAETPPADAKPAADKPAVPPPPKFQPLEKVKGDIRTGLAQPIAQEQMNAAMKAAIDEVIAFGKKYRRWKGAQEAEVKSTKLVDPGQLNLDGLAARHGLKSGSTKLVDRHAIGEYEIGQKVMEFDEQAMRMGRFTQLSFADLAFGQSDTVYNPHQVSSIEPDISYVFWSTDEQEAADPVFDKVKDEVVEAWKLKKAFDLAKTEAQKLAEKAKSAESLKDVVDPTKVELTVPFSWLSTGSLGFNFGGGEPSLSTVPGIDLPGQEFMEGVFALNPGQAGIAPNQAHTKVYVVRVLSQEPTDDVLKDQFLESGLNFQVMGVAQREMYRTTFDWYEGLEKEMGLVWQRPVGDAGGE